MFFEGLCLNHLYSESDKEIEKQKIHEIRKNVDSLTNELVTRLNKINALLKEIEQGYHPTVQSLNILESY